MNIVVSFDGLNRSGKGTQLRLLREYLGSSMVPALVVRGDGSREGIGNLSYFDPPSKWWRNWQANQNKTINDWDRAYERLKTEVQERYDRFSNENASGYFLMDRCYVSRWFVKRQAVPDFPIEDIIRENPVFPDKYFFMDAPQEVLLSRQSDDNPTKAEFRREIVSKWYHLWQDTLLRLEDRLEERFIRLDATKLPEEIHKEVLTSLNLNKT